ncbi:TetR/AcrR family transcriptional regulator [Dactylosporangium sp. CA-139066]|uniref:TetR/AcrR family transcriptional regulator n=1 Tax=Dactylosporangium sp. CA-139066 TaxID=3239930 RepID=UPI003D8D5A5E
MPKSVDHQQRRARIAGALLRVAAERGLEAVSVRHVAEEAGVSAGMVQHYFSNREEMMAFALSVVQEHHRARLTAAVAALDSPAPRALLRAFGAAVLPLDEERVVDGKVGLAFLAYTAVRPAAADSVRAGTARMVAFVAEQIGAAQPDPHSAAVGFLAFVEGLSLHVLGGHHTPAAALAALDTHLDLIFGPC